jgi:hypothetical protein
VISAGCGTLNTQPSGLQAKLEQNGGQLWPWQEIGVVVAHVKTPNANHNGLSVGAFCYVINLEDL